ncbi:tetratricopeptide repeat protein 37-like isoform X1 [Branchiostoma floridae]|uniref:Tetratricopeptide repeat protein 37-like isoform X1 n=1 Tax=Branchiostoma floridae TaxID=7739 RepID=A0A9J7KNC8_BRAFL|nr:tetratricopeptide repeat protein 37-like isoform X1 [Branchiostoma floridae]XP_035667183.1 tetratricopeptide repeat protein 37-like isoform X1 [Branchiostoma floridae]XP_035667184.1 tetratricopeptide repeat protein 37-like isoform X1 [Branchiostoma floridae]XP_035667185.1 tetratricopeptide repeat protein 37-like isoform X1 [Branchiostoma floridae]
MSSKETKAALKAAREAIRKKEYKEALKHCKDVLKQDKNNYHALVFVGVAAAELDQPDQAQAAYRRAAEAEPDQLLAWQGLCGFYEKLNRPDQRQELSDVYSRLMKLCHSDKTKWQELAAKQGDLLAKVGDVRKAVEVWREIIVAKEADDNDNVAEFWVKIITVLSQQKGLSIEDMDLLKKAYSTVIKSGTVVGVDHRKHYEGYIRLLLENHLETAAQIEALCRDMASTHPDSTFPLQTLCLLGIEDDSVSEATLASCTKLQSLDPDSSAARLLQGFHLLHREPARARQLLQTGVGSRRDCVYGWLHLAQVQVKLHDCGGAIDSARQGLKVLEKLQSVKNRDTVQRKLTLLLAESLTGSNLPANLTEALHLYTQEAEKEPSCQQAVQGLCQTYIKLGDLDKAEKLCYQAIKSDATRHTMVALLGLVFSRQGKYEEAEEQLKKAVELDSEVALYHFLLGQLYWIMGDETKKDKSKCMTSLLKAAKLDPHHSDTFLYLGHYYRDVAGDVQRSKRCYQKAFDLDQSSEEAGAAFGDACIALGEEEAGLKLYVSVTSKASAGTAKWAWLRLGLYQLKHGDGTQAVKSLQAALRADPKDPHCWECLAEAYLSRGGYTGALKAFTKAAELNPEATYSLYQVAAIKQVLGQFPDAIAEYQIILEKDNGYVPALKGLGETYLAQAREALNEYLNGRVVDASQSAILALAKGVSVRADLSCLWKLLGDACTLLHPLSADLVTVNVPGSLLRKGKEVAEDQVMGKRDVLALGGRCYGRALRLAEDCSSLWHDLGLNYFYQAQEDSDKEASKGLVEKATQALKKAITLESGNHKHWTALGVVTASKEADNPELAQHAFIKSTQAEPNNVEAWTNLGALYLRYDQVELAHQTFKVAQSLNPSYVASWIGQALVAETIGHEEAMDLFRHTTELGTHLEGGIGYANWVCATLQDTTNRNSDVYKYNIVQMGAVLAASLALSKYTDRVHSNPTAYNMLGLLLEHQGLLQGAERAFSCAVELLSGTGDQDKLNKALCNHGRVLCAGGRFEEAVTQYRAVSPLGEFRDVCGLAHALYRAGKLEESYAAYEQAFQVAPSDTDKSCVLAAMAMVAHKFEDVERAKTLLFRCSQLQPPSVHGLQALCALGLTNGDVTLASAALAELLKQGDDQRFLSDVSFLTACLCAAQGDNMAARNAILKNIHKYPSETKLWELLAAFTLQQQPQHATAAHAAAQVPHTLTPTPTQEQALNLSLGKLAAGVHTRDRRTDGLVAAQKAVHLYPGQLTSWLVLTAAVYANNVVSKVKGQGSYRKGADLGCTRVITALLEQPGQPENSPVMKQWATVQTVSSLMELGRFEEAKNTCNKESTPSPPLSTLSAMADIAVKVTAGQPVDSVEQLRTAVLSNPTAMAWQLLSSVYQSQGMVVAAEMCYRQSLQVATSPQGKTTALLRLAYLALLMVQGKGADVERWKSLALEATNEALKIDPWCTTAQLLQGALYFSLKNIKLSKKTLERLLFKKQSKKTLERLLLQTSVGEDLTLSVTRLYLLKILLAKDDALKISELLKTAEEQEDPLFEKLKQIAGTYS